MCNEWTRKSEPGLANCSDVVCGSECWCSRKEGERQILTADMTWLRTLLRVTRRDKMSNETVCGILCQETTLHGWQNSRAKTKLVWACIKNGKRTAASKSITLLYQWENKPSKTTEEMDGQCKWRYRSKEVDCTISNGSGVGQKQMETSSSSLIIIEMMEESRRRRVTWYSRLTWVKTDSSSYISWFRHQPSWLWLSGLNYITGKCCVAM